MKYENRKTVGMYLKIFSIKILDVVEKCELKTRDSDIGELN